MKPSEMRCKGCGKDAQQAGTLFRASGHWHCSTCTVLVEKETGVQVDPIIHEITAIVESDRQPKH